MSWSANLTDELVTCCVPPAEAAELTRAAEAEAAAAGEPPATVFGPAVVYARELAAALRAEQPSRAPFEPTQGVPVLRDPAPVVLRLRDVRARRGRRAVLHGVSLEVRAGEVVAVVGANGAGKSTLLQVCAGILRPTSGTVERVRDFGYAPQSSVQAPLLSVDEHIRLFGAAQLMAAGRASAAGDAVLRQLGWHGRGDQLMGTLSGGSQQKVNVALAQLHAPRLLLLDEPYQGFDALAYEDLWQLIEVWRAQGAGVLLITHLLRDTRVDRVLELPSPEDHDR